MLVKKKNMNYINITNSDKGVADLKAVYVELQRRMDDKDVSDKELAAVAGINRLSFYLKMRGIMRWKLAEVLRICVFFKDADIDSLFLRLDTKS